MNDDSDEYLFGRFEERQQSERELFQKSFEKIVFIAEAFLNLVKSAYSEIKINQFRIGIDYSSRIPAAIMLVDSKDRDNILKMIPAGRTELGTTYSEALLFCDDHTRRPAGSCTVSELACLVLSETTSPRAARLHTIDCARCTAAPCITTPVEASTESLESRYIE